MQTPRIEIAKGGWSFDRKDYSAPVMRFLTVKIESRRHLVDIGGEAERGARFKDNGSVIARVISNYTEEEFMADPVLTVDAMLIDTAQSDWWYHYEKPYMDERDSRDYSEDDNDDE